MSQPIGDIAMNLGHEVMYQNLPPGQAIPQHQHHQQDGKSQQPSNLHGQPLHVVIPGLREQLYQESLAKSKQDPSDITIHSL